MPASMTHNVMRDAGRSAVVVGDAPLTVGDVGRVAGGERVDLSDDAIERITASRAVVDRLVNGEALIYGLNTGLGHMRNERVPLGVLQAYQQGIVLGHAGGIGPGLPTRVVRAAMFVRLVGIARGGAGSSLAVARQLAALLNARVHPVVPEVGSIGAADLMHMAAIASVAIGHGQAEFEGGDPRGRRSAASRRPGARAAAAQGRPRARLGQRRVDRSWSAARSRGGVGGRPGGRGPGSVTRGDRRKCLDRRSGRAARKAGSGADRIGRSHPRPAGRQRPVRARRRRVGPGRALVPGRYSAAAQEAQLRGLAGPATLDVAPLDVGIEDHATNATLAVDQSARALRLLIDIVAIELLMARDALRRNASPGRLGAGTAAAIAALDALPELGTDLPAAVHEAVRIALPRITAAAEAAAGLPDIGAEWAADRPPA